MSDQPIMETEELLRTDATFQSVDVASMNAVNEDAGINAARIDDSPERKDDENIISGEILTGSRTIPVEEGENTQDQSIIDNQEDITFDVRRAVQKFLTDDNLSWSMKTWREKIMDEIKLKISNDDTKAIIKQIVHEELQDYMKMSQISEVEDDVTEQMNEDAGDDSCTQLQSEIVDQNFESGLSQFQVNMICIDIIPT